MAIQYAKLLTTMLDQKVLELSENFDEEVEILVDELIEISPKDTGFLKDSWQAPIKISDFHYRLINTAEYAWFPLIEGNSDQLPMGILPHIREWKSRMGGN